MKKGNLKMTGIVCLVCVLTAMVFCSCGPNNQSNTVVTTEASGTGTPDVTTGAASTEAQKTEPVNLRFMDVVPNPERTAQLQKMVDSFNAQSDGVTAVLESTPWEDAHQKIVTLGATNNMPDTFIMHQQWYAEFINAGWVSKMDEYYNVYKHKEDLIPYVRDVLIDFDQSQAYGGVYGIPDGISVHAMFVRSDWIEAAGLTLDDLETWEGVFSAAEKINIPGQNQYGFTYRGARLGGEQMGMYVMGELNGELYDDQGNCLLNTPTGKEAIKRYTDLYLNGFAPKDSVNWGYADMVQGFTSGLTGIMNQTNQVVATCRTSMEDGTWTTIPFPRSSDGNIYAKADSFVYAIGSDSKNPKEAFDFIGHMVSPDLNREFCKTTLYIPVMTGAESDPDFSEGAMSGFFRGINDPTFVREPYYGYFPELGEFMETVYDAEIQKYLLGQQSLDELCDHLAGFLTEKQQAYMASDPNAQIPRPISIK